MDQSRAIQHLPQSRQRLSKRSRAAFSGGVMVAPGANAFSRRCTSFRQSFLFSTGSGTRQSRATQMNTTFKISPNAHHLISPLERVFA